MDYKRTPSDAVAKFNAGRASFDKWDVPTSPAQEVLLRRVFANMRPVGTTPNNGAVKSGDPSFDAMLQKLTSPDSV